MKKRRFLGGLLGAAVLIAALAGSAFAAPSVTDAYQATASKVLADTPAPTISSVGGDWAVLGLSRSGYAVPASYYSDYAERVAEAMQQARGSLSGTKYTEYSRLILALTAIGEDVTDVGGYNLLAKLADFDSVKKQGMNGLIFALLALECHDYEVPTIEGISTHTSRELLLQELLSREITAADGTVGGFALTGNVADPDVTAMALQALAFYQDNAKVQPVIERGISALSRLQDNKGGFAAWDSRNSESVAQAIVALCALGIDPQTDSRFIKEENSLLDALLSFYVEGGGFAHLATDEKADAMATEQGLYALAAYQRLQKGQTALYDMSDVFFAQDGAQVTFADVKNHWAKTDVELLATKGIIKGTAPNTFSPENQMTRAEFVTVLVRALGLKEISTEAFSDVSLDAWYNGAIGAYAKQCLKEQEQQGEFRPNAAITREEAADAIARVTQAAGIENTLTLEEGEEYLSRFPDTFLCGIPYRLALAYNVQQGFLKGDEAGRLNPQGQLTRAEAVTVLSRMLEKTGLLIK